MEEDMMLPDYEPFADGETDKDRYIVQISYSSDELYEQEIENYPSFYMFEDEDAAFGFLFAFIHRMDKRNGYEMVDYYSRHDGIVTGALYKNGDKTVKVNLTCELVCDRSYKELRYKGKTGGRLRFV